ncbi:hypothetical protein CYMTET_33683 [Cymbomonas tetramitiformis]|uniref:Uncharacterized protein n=1 Tax=Cymbomonas tetramitiformis TaxID=36881 RepID=A0AAE0KQQ2_9CHLO|nr:hypothetical protein CYMTET_33683 [Cymbomonas tetramitiformis]
MFEDVFLYLLGVIGVIALFLFSCDLREIFWANLLGLLAYCVVCVKPTLKDSSSLTKTLKIVRALTEGLIAVCLSLFAIYVVYRSWGIEAQENVLMTRAKFLEISQGLDKQNHATRDLFFEILDNTSKAKVDDFNSTFYMKMDAGCSKMKDKKRCRTLALAQENLLLTKAQWEAYAAMEDEAILRGDEKRIEKAEKHAEKHIRNKEKRREHRVEKKVKKQQHKEGKLASFRGKYEKIWKVQKKADKKTARRENERVMAALAENAENSETPSDVAPA